jgi:hypothetical protein
MNRKTFFILLGLLVALGGAGLLVFWQDLAAWRSTSAKIGSKPFASLQVGAVAKIQFAGAKGTATLQLKDGRWVVKERNDYGANVPQITDLLMKLPDVKVVQTESVGPSLFGRIELLEPGKDVKPENAGTRFDLADKDGKTLGNLLLGKQIIKTEDSPLPIKPQTPVGRYILVPGNPTVLVLSDALRNAEARPERWLNKEFFKAERIKTLTSGGSAADMQWKITRSEEYGQWKFAAGGGNLDASAAVGAVNALAKLEFVDVAVDVKPDSLKNARTFTAETFDNLTYTVQVTKKPDGDDYYLTVALNGEPPRERRPEKGEKPEEKERLDKQFTEDLKRLDDRVKREKSFAPWTYVVTAKTLEPLLKDRNQLIPAKKPQAPKG